MPGGLKLELAEGGHHRHHRHRPEKWIRGYHREANDVPRYRRHLPLHDSSLFSFKLGDGGYLYLCVPDPNGLKAPRYVREDMFDSLSDYEMGKVINYVMNVNPKAKLEAIVARRDERRATLGDASLLSDGESAIQIVQSAFDMEVVPSGTDSVVVNHDPETGVSFWDEEILGVKMKVAVPVGLGLFLLLK